MKILSLTLENFRSIKNMTVNFDGQDADVLGANGTGKTTIANAICWLLIDRPIDRGGGLYPQDRGDARTKPQGKHDRRTSKRAEAHPCEGLL